MRIQQISTLSDYEYVKLVATIESSYEKGFDCSKCTAVSQRFPERIFNKQKTKGCFDYKTASFLIGEPSKERCIKFSGCVGNYTSFSVNYFFDLFSNFEKGVLPFKGTLAQQPAKIIEVFQVIARRSRFKQEQEIEKGKK